MIPDVSRRDGETSRGGDELKRSRRRSTGFLGDWPVFALLLFLVWGSFAGDRGLWKDDVLLLARAHERLAESPEELLVPQAHTPTRRLQLVAFAAALWSGQPRLALQVLYGATWLALGLCVGATARAIFPRRRRLAYLATAVALCSTGDFYVNSPGSLHYSLSALAFFLALLAAFRWQSRGGSWWLVGMVLFVQLSVYQIDAALTSFILAPLLMWLRAGRRITRRMVTLVGLWCLALTPYAIEFTIFMRADDSYASWGVLQLSWLEWTRRSMSLFAHNFMPWEWFTREQVFFGWGRPEVIPWSWRITSAVAGSVALVGWLLRRGYLGERSDENLDFWLAAASCLMLTAAANAMFAFAQLSEFVYRTQIVSSLWSALVVAAVCDWILSGAVVFKSDVVRSRALAFVGLALPTVFVGLGILGGLERQNFYLASWQQQQRELKSLLTAVPGLDDDAYLFLRVPASPRGLATEHTEYARQWVMLLYGKPDLTERVFVESYLGGGCQPRADGLFCRHQRAGAGRFQRRYEEHWEVLVPYEKLIVATFDATIGEYRLDTILPSELRGAAELYSPKNLITPSGAQARGRALLGGGELLAGWLAR